MNVEKKNSGIKNIGKYLPHTCVITNKNITIYVLCTL